MVGCSCVGVGVRDGNLALPGRAGATGLTCVRVGMALPVERVADGLEASCCWVGIGVPVEPAEELRDTGGRCGRIGMAFLDETPVPALPARPSPGTSLTTGRTDGGRLPPPEPVRLKACPWSWAALGVGDRALLVFPAAVAVSICALIRDVWRSVR